jgi:hypothetical protein
MVMSDRVQNDANLTFAIAVSSKEIRVVRSLTVERMLVRTGLREINNSMSPLQSLLDDDMISISQSQPRY